eukprot:13247435-Alexandrium_andersonii.AAC.1
MHGGQGPSQVLEDWVHRAPAPTRALAELALSECQEQVSCADQIVVDVQSEDGVVPGELDSVQ